MSENGFVRIALEAGVLTITLDRPKVNAFNMEMISSLQSALKQAERDDSIRSVLLSSEGRVFSAGQDIKEFRERKGESFRYHLLRTYNPLVLQLRRLEKPVLASIPGPVSGAALGLILACDLRIAAEEALFVVGFAGIGLAADSAVSLLLPATVGLGRAAEMSFTNRPVRAQDALAWGLVNRVVPGDQLREQASAWAIELAQGAIGAMGLIKRGFNKAVLGNLEQVLDYEAHIQEIAGQRAEHTEGVEAFLNKRQPRFV